MGHNLHDKSFFQFRVLLAQGQGECSSELNMCTAGGSEVNSSQFPLGNHKSEYDLYWDTPIPDRMKAGGQKMLAVWGWGGENSGHTWHSLKRASSGLPCIVAGLGGLSGLL